MRKRVFQVIYSILFSLCLSSLDVLFHIKNLPSPPPPGAQGGVRSPWSGFTGNNNNDMTDTKCCLFIRKLVLELDFSLPILPYKKKIYIKIYINRKGGKVKHFFPPNPSRVKIIAYK